MIRRRGFTLIELLCVLGALAVLSTISVPVLKSSDQKSKERQDNAMILIYNQAFESFRWNDYSTLALTETKNVTFEENGRVKISSSLNMDSDEVAALASSGRGSYPQTREECIAMIKLYTGTDEEPGYPAEGTNYDFFYSINTGKVIVAREQDILPGLRGSYIRLSGE